MSKRYINVVLDGTDEMLAELYAAYNRAYYDDQLPHDVVIKFGNLGVNSYGVWKPGTKTIIVARCMRRFNRLVCLIVHHEMAHVAAGADYSHGKKFQAGMKRLAKADAFANIW